jgi:hypothetical protein
MWWHGELWTITAVEDLAKEIIGNHDRLPRRERDNANGIVSHFKLSKERPRLSRRIRC